MTRELAIKELEQTKDYPISEPASNEALDMAIKALEQEPCDDAISRQKAIDTIDALYLDGDSSVSFRASAEGDTLIGKYQAITALDDLPPVTPRPKIGHWIKCYILQEFKCSECRVCFRNKSNYCPNCGAKMESEG